MKNTPRFAIIGFGEVGQILAQDLVGAGCEVAGTYDLKFADPGSVPSRAAVAPYRAGSSHHDAVRGAQLVISSVTAEQGFEAAKAVAGGLEPGAFYVDVNSVSPGVKHASAEAINAAGGRYVEAAVMTAVPPHRLKSPMLLGGPHAAAFLELATPLGFNAKIYSTDYGKASAVKMCRSVMIKGLEALVIESYTTARAYGVEDHVLPTLAETFPSIDWPQQGAYFFSRVVQHGKRRAEEMRESANTVREAGFVPFMAEAIADKQQWVADQANAGVFDGVAKGARWQDYADRLIAARKPR